MDHEPKLRAIAAGRTSDEKGKLLGILTEQVFEEMLGNTDELLAELAAITQQMLDDMEGDGHIPEK